MRRPVHGAAGSVPRRGTTLVEVMVAIVILAVLALASAASLEYARSMSVLQRDRRTALELANSRLEELRGAAYPDVKPAPPHSFAVYYIRKLGGGTWVVSAGGTNETVLVNGRSRSLVSTVQFVDVDGGSASYDALRFTVRVQYRAGADEVVTLETLKAP